MSNQRAQAWPPDPSRLGLAWLSDPSTQVMSDLGIELKKIEKKEKKREGRQNFYRKSNKFINIKNKLF